jgi:hypothetical protein
MPRLRLYDVRLSRLPELVGKCQADITAVANYVNSAQRRLLLCREAGDEGWWGTWAEVAFNLVSRNNPYITCPREIARLEKLDVCGRPMWIQNQFYEYLDFGNGRMPKRHGDSDCFRQAYTRNNVVTFTDQSIAPCKIRIYASDPADVGSASRVLLQGLDQNGNPVYTTDNLNQVTGEFVTLQSPFADSLFSWNQINGIQKDQTIGNVQIFQVDAITGNQTLLLTMEPSEKVAGYRRYYLHNLPASCCHVPTNVVPVQVTAIAKLELVPVQVDTDYLLFQNLEAIIEEAQSVRYSEIDSEAAKKMAQEKHTQAVRLLQGELVHYLGKTTAAVNFAPFGTARLERQKIGTLI